MSDAGARTRPPMVGSGVRFDAAQHLEQALARRMRIEPGERDDLTRLLMHHYEAGAPATVVRIDRLIDTRANTLAGVLAVSMPTLNGRWRGAAWPGDYRTGTSPHAKRRDARRLNRDVRCISRVVIDPRYRGVGLARTLVAWYLASPDTVRTEAVAAMGAVQPFFASAGMSPVRLVRSHASLRLLDALSQARLPPTTLLSEVGVRRCISEPWLVAELRRWARIELKDHHAQTRATPREDARTLPPGALARRAALKLLRPTTAYTHDARGSARAREGGVWDHENQTQASGVHRGRSTATGPISRRPRSS